MSAFAARRLDFAPSRRFAAAILLAHAAAGASLMAVLPGWQGGVLGLLVLALGAAAAGRRALLLGPWAVTALELTGPDCAVLFLADGRRIEGSVSRVGPVNRYWVGLRAVRLRRTLLIASDMLAEPQFRLLRLWTLWGRLPARAAGSQAA